MTELKDQPRGAQVMIACRSLRVHKRPALRQRMVRLVVVDNDHINAAPFDLRDTIRPRGPAIERDQEVGPASAEAALYPLPGKTVTFLQSKRQKGDRSGPVRAQNPRQKSDRSYAVDVVTPIQNDLLTVIDPVENPVDCRPDTGNQEGIAKVSQPG